MKILITIFCPFISKSYEFWISPQIHVSDAIDVLCEKISEYEKKNDLFISRDELILYSYLEQRALLADYTLKQSGIKSGDIITII